MTNREAWNRFKEHNEVNIVGEFENEYGERYIIYRMKNEDVPYFTGDEVDWQPRVRLLWNRDFMFNEEEREQIARILWPTVNEQFRTLAQEWANRSTRALEQAICKYCGYQIARQEDNRWWFHVSEGKLDRGCRAASWSRDRQWDNRLQRDWRATPAEEGQPPRVEPRRD